jgi:hypothetical protein
MLFRRQKKPPALKAWDAGLWEHFISRLGGSSPCVGLLINGFSTRSDSNSVDREFYGTVHAEAESPAGHIPISLSWVTDGFDDVQNGRPRWRWGTARISREGRDVCGYVSPQEHSPTYAQSPWLSVVLGTDPEGLKLFETLILRAKSFGAKHVYLRVWLEPLEDDVGPESKHFHRLMTVSRFIYEQQVRL